MRKGSSEKLNDLTTIRFSGLVPRNGGGVDKTTLRSFDDHSLTSPAKFTPEEIRSLRVRNRLSQPVFARYLNTSESTVQKWESGAKKPTGSALKLLAVVRKHGLAILT